MKFGIISLGNHALTKVIPAIRSLGHEVTAVFSTDTSKGEKVSKELGAEYVPDLRKMSSMDVESVYISSPNYLHYSYSKLFLESGKSVLLEKPATLRVEEIEELTEIARRNDLKLSIGFHLRFHPAVETVKNMILTGKIGKVVYAYGKWSYYSPRAGDTSWKAKPDMAGGGSIAGTGVHIMDSFVNLFGNDVTSVSAFSSPKCKIIDETVHATLNFASGIIVDCISSRLMDENYNDLIIIGERGVIRVANFYSTSVKSEIHLNGSMVGRFEEGDMYSEEVNAFVKGDPRIAGGEAGITSTKLVLAVQKSACSGEIIALG
ncbi:MAG: Gfo/Idh/MocA family oxidoreductase [Thermoplasmatales archaeon]